ncbi:hypothetical protein [Thermomonas paludicola]|uniref:hypothetical protein n=1 Tax=Thermomonas paludicola TaxID=2884874 RepID=UPI002115A747|nr:hypothetical protein [Thermomonas paludicola]
MLSNPTRSSGLLVLAVVLALAANAALYFRMSARLDAIETTQRLRDESSLLHAPSSDDTATGYPTAVISPSMARGLAVTKLTPEQLVQRLSQRNGGNPTKVAADMNRLMQQEPSLPGLESQQGQWLESAFGAMSTSGSQPSDTQSSCRGRRCVVSATFADPGQAQDWAGNYLLAAGGKMLQRSRTIVVPVANGSTKLLLYFY